MGFLYNKIMKKFLLFVFAAFWVLPVFAQEDLDYSVRIILKKDASAEIQEKITFYTDSEIELPSLERTIDADIDSKKISINSNIRSTGFALDKIGNKTFLKTTMIPMSRIGRNYLILSYVLPDAVYSALGKDVFKFDLNLSEWPYQFKEGKVLFKVDGSHINKDTLLQIGKASLPLEENEEFSITPFISKDISLDLSFEKGFFDTKPAIFSILSVLVSIAPILITFILILYSYMLWRKYGKDPKGPFVTEYDPPNEITPAFAKYILNREAPIDFSYVTITLISLAMQGYIKIGKYKGEICCTSLKGSDSSGLFEEDKIIYESLFAYSPQLVLDDSSATYIQSAFKRMIDRITVKGEDFFHANVYYMSVPLGLLLLSFLIIFAAQSTFDAYVSKFCFGISLASFGLLFKFIDNIAPRYVKTYCKLMGFRQYMMIAEEGRVHFSNPFDKERLFCDYLPYAYAFGMEKQLIAKFKNEFDERIRRRYIEYLGSIEAIPQEQISSTLATIALVVGLSVAAAAAPPIAAAASKSLLPAIFKGMKK